MTETDSRAPLRGMPSDVRSSVLAVGDRVRLEVTDIAFGGEGVGRHGGLVVFVPFVLVGEEVQVEIQTVRKDFARARLLEVLQSSPDRVKPECRYFGECGGCQYQHMAYPVQVRLKGKQVAGVFQRLGGFAPELVQPVVPCSRPYGYRNRIMVRSQWDKPRQTLVIGYIRHDNRLVVDVEECRIADPVLNEQLRGVRAQPPPKGGLKVVLRVAPEGWVVPEDSFFQNNFVLLPELVATVRDRLRLGGRRWVVDAYCGVGFFALEVADLVERYVGIEYDRRAVRAARQNAEHRGHANGEFLAGTVEELLPGILEKQDARETAIILDPPRRGCPGATIACLRAHRPAQILYVSCHPATLARDLHALCSDGAYELSAVVPLDMFPQTQHVECVADLRAGGSSELGARS